MSQLHLSDEILMAFADGELEESTAAAIAKAMAEDPAVAKRIMDFQQSRRLTRSALSATLPDVPPELRAAVSARIKAYETAGKAKMRPDFKPPLNEWLRRRRPFMQVALAASIVASALGLGYFVGRQDWSEENRLLAQLDNPIVHHELNTIASGTDVELPFGRLRVISTYRVTNGSLCREFRLQSLAETAEAVACRNGEWNVTFALAGSIKTSEYTPSGESDLMAAYLQSMGAGQPLVDEAEIKALSEVAR
jgi:hypothetical protein